MADILSIGILVVIFAFILPDWKRPLGPWRSNRNLYFIVIIWVIILINLHYEHLANSAYYDWQISGTYESRDSTDTMIAYYKKSSLFGSLIWGTFFTGYFLNKHLNLLKVKDEE